MDMTPLGPAPVCRAPQTAPQLSKRRQPWPGADCTVALCVHVSVAKQKRLDLIDELQLRGSTVFCTSIPGICRAQQRQVNILVQAGSCTVCTVRTCLCCQRECPPIATEVVVVVCVGAGGRGEGGSGVCVCVEGGEKGEGGGRGGGRVQSQNR